MTNKNTLEPGVICLHNIPKGFTEKPMVQYFAQFGEVTRLRMSRSSKTGKTRHYAYIEFACDDVAKIAADAMNNYLMFERILKCEYIPKERVHSKMFKAWNERGVTTVQRHKTKCNASRNYERERILIKKKLQNIRKAETKLKELGIDFKCTIVNDPKANSDEQDSQDQVVIDSSDEDIVFQTPPTARKVKKTKKVAPVKVIEPEKVLKIRTVTPKTPKSLTKKERPVRKARTPKMNVLRVV
jgi:nucleolar protein 15